jgi:CHASE3 domain sensor protein
MEEGTFFLTRMGEYFDQRQTIDQSVDKMKDIIQNDPKAKARLDEINEQQKESQQIT